LESKINPIPRQSILVTGGAGYIGAHIVDLLCDYNLEVIVLDNLSNGFEENLNSKAKFIKGDIRSKDALVDIFENYNISTVIHLAAFKAVGASMSNTSEYTDNNIIGSLNLISLSIKYNVKKFIFSSTAAVYGNPLYTPIDEKHQTIPINHYGYTKLYIENYLKWISKFEPLKFVSLRYFNAAGYTFKKDLINFKEKKPENLLPIVMEVSANKRSHIEIFGNNYDTEDGTCVRDYIHVLDLAEAHIKAISYLDDNDSITVNLSTGLGASVLEVVQLAEDITKNKINHTFSDRREGDPAVLISSYDKAKEYLDWIPKYSIDEIISSMWNIYKNKEAN
tara:strand:- start:250 stop:1257 length:1008 start_codon:yes stop_codon:yes gene_type:complete